MISLSEDYLLNLIGKYGEGVSLDYKEESYHIAVKKKDKHDKAKLERASKSKRDLVVDLTALANSNGGSIALIITGIKETQTSFEKVGIEKGLYSDTMYQNILEGVVTPSVQFTYQELTDEKGYTFGFFILQYNFFRPYVLTKSDPYGKFSEGTIPTRNGSTNKILRDIGERTVHWQREDSEFRRNIAHTAGVFMSGEYALIEPSDDNFSTSIVNHMASLKRKVEKLTADQIQVLHSLRYKNRVIITGCAGSGKTLLVAEKAIRLDQSGIRTLVLCHNPVLARYIKDLVSNPAIDVFDITTFITKSAGKQPAIYEDWNEFVEPLEEDIEKAFDSLNNVPCGYEAVIVDEGQDFRESWWIIIEVLLQYSKNKILYIFCDDNQALLPYRSIYPIYELPISMSKNCRNGGNIFEIVKKFHKDSPLVSSFLHSEGIVKLTIFDDASYESTLENVLIDAYKYAEHSQLCVITNESSANKSIINNYQFIKYSELNWRSYVQNDLTSIRDKAIEKIVCLRSSASISEITNRFGIPLQEDIEDYLRLPVFSQENFPTAQDIANVNNTASRLIPFFEGKIIYGGVRFDIRARRLLLVGTTDTGRPRTVVNTASRLNFYAKNNWAESLHSIKPTTIVAQGIYSSLGGDILPLYSIDMFKGLESDAVILFISATKKNLWTQMYIGSSRAIGYLHIVVSENVLSKLGQRGEFLSLCST